MHILPHAIHAEVFLEYALVLGLQFNITLRPRRQKRRVRFLRQVVIKCGWGNRQHTADWLDPVNFAMIFYEPDHRLNGRSSSVPLHNNTCLHV